MISKNPINKRVDWIKTETSISVYPERIKQRYNIPSKTVDLWGGFPGKDKIKETLIVNPGPAMQGYYSKIEISENDVKVEMLRI